MTATIFQRGNTTQFGNPKRAHTMAEKIHFKITTSFLSFKDLANFAKNVEIYKGEDAYRNITGIDNEVIIAVIAAGSLTINNFLEYLFMLVCQKISKEKMLRIKMDDQEIVMKNVSSEEVNEVIAKLSKAKKDVLIEEIPANK